MPSSILTPYPADFRPPSISAGFYKPTAAGAGGQPIFTGSAKTGLGTPLPGAVLRVNEFGLDEVERIWIVQTTKAAALKPEPRDPDPYLGGMYCTESSSTDGEGLMSTIRATYKGLVKNQVRPAARQCFTDIETQSLSLQNGTSETGVSGAGTGSMVNVVQVQGIPVPTPVYTLRGASATQPDKTVEGTYFTKPPGAPDVTPLFETPIFVGNAVLLYLQFSPYKIGWLCEKIEWSEAALHFETTVQYRQRYFYSGTRPPKKDGS